MRVGERGQVTIPKEVRDRAGIVPGTELEFGIEGDVVTMRRARGRGKPGPTRGEKIVASLRGTKTANLDLSTDEIMRFLRGDD